MKNYLIQYESTVDWKKLQKLSKDELYKIEKDIASRLGTHPEIFGKPLRKSLKGYRRLRIGNRIRAIFRIEEQKVVIVFIGEKPNVYKEYLKK